MPKTKPLKTRGGCTKCKSRRVKCDEQRPQCSNCLRLGYKEPCKYDANFKAPKGRVTASKQPVIHHDAARPAAAPVSALPPHTRSSESEPSSYSILDMELLHRYTLDTAPTIAHTNKLRAWQQVMPAMAYAYPPLMRALVAVAALHTASKDPSRAAVYIPRATELINSGLPHFKELVANIECGSVHVAMAYASAVALYGFALPAVRSRIEPLENPLTALIEAITLIQGSVVVTGVRREELGTGPLGALFEAGNRASEKEFSSWRRHPDLSASSFRMLTIHRVVSLDQLMESYCKEHGLDAYPAYHDSTLHLASIASELVPDTPIDECKANDIHVAAEMTQFRWPATLKPEFMELLRDGDIPALTALAYFCLFLATDVWYMSGWRQAILPVVEKAVKVEPWRQHVAWVAGIARRN